MKALKPLTLVLSFWLCALTVCAQEVKEYALTIKNNRFEPSELSVPANTKIKLTITNQDAGAEEFESKTLKLEKIIAAGKTATLFAGPLKPGRYPFEGEFHSKTARGVVIAE
jgi:hypothetical protein